MKTQLTALGALVVAGATAGQDLIFSLDVRDATNSSIWVEFVGSAENSDFVSAVTAFDFTLKGLTSITVPRFDSLVRIGPGNFVTIEPGGVDPLAGIGGQPAVDFETGRVNWFAQPPAGPLSPFGAWTGTRHEIARFTYECDGNNDGFL